MKERKGKESRKERKEGKKYLRDGMGYHAILVCTGTGATTVLIVQSMETEVYF